MSIHYKSFKDHCTHWHQISNREWTDIPKHISCLECCQLYQRSLIYHKSDMDCALRTSREVRYGVIWDARTSQLDKVTCEACKNQLRKANTPITETSSQIVAVTKTRHWLAITAKGIREIACTREIAYNLGSTKTISIAEQLDQVNCLGCLDYLVWLTAGLKQRVKATQETHKAWHASWVQMWANIGAAAQVWRPRPKVEDTMSQDETARKRFELLEID